MRPPGNRPPMTRKERSTPSGSGWKIAGQEIEALDEVIEMRKDGRLSETRITARPAFASP